MLSSHAFRTRSICHLSSLARLLSGFSGVRKSTDPIWETRDEFLPLFRCPHFAPAVESQLIKDIIGIVNDLGAECAALNSCRQHIQPLTEVYGDRRHLGDRKITLTVNQNRWPHEGNRLLFHPTIHNSFNRIDIVFIPGVPTMGQNSADELTSKRNWQ